MSAGAELIVRAADRTDNRPLWVLAWGGANTLAQALLHVRATRTPSQVDALVARLRVYAISDQDDAGPWLRREFPALHYIAMPSTQDGEEYAAATWTGISGDRFYKNAPGADFTTFTDDWVNTHVRAAGPLGALYPYPCCIHEGDTPSFMNLIDNGLAAAMSPAYGGWGGRYVWRQPSGEPRAFWTQGGDSYPGRDSSRDTVVGDDGRSYTSDQATIWRWREAFQHDFAARMAWTTANRRDANHNPEVVVNGQSGRGPITVDAVVGTPVALDAAGTRDPDGHALRYRWWFYAEAGAGIPGAPLVTRSGATRDVAAVRRHSICAGRRPSRASPARGPRQRGYRRRDGHAPHRRHRAHHPGRRGLGDANLTSYRRVILRIAPTH